MNTPNRMKSSTAVIAFAAGLVLLATSGHANAKGGNSHQGQGAAVNSTAAGPAAKTTPVYTCMACRFVKRDGDDKHKSQRKPGHDMPGRDMSKQDKPRGDKRADSKPVATTGAKPTPPVASKPVTPPTPPLATVKVSNGVETSLIKDAPGGLLVTSTSPGTITISNGNNAVTFPNQAVSLSGAVSVGAGAGVQVFREKNGDIVALAKSPAAPAPAPMPPGPVVRDHRPGGNADHVTRSGTVTGGPDGGFLYGLGDGLVHLLPGTGGFSAHIAPENVTPPKTSTPQ